MSNTKIRIGNDIDISWTLVDGDGNPYPLAGRDISVEIVVGGVKRVRISGVEVVGVNTLHFTYWGKDQKYAGACDLKFIENDGHREMVTFDTQAAFTLVSHSWQAVDSGERPERIYLEYTTVTSQLTERVGPTGPAAGFGAVTAKIDGRIGTPEVSVTTDGPDTAKNFHFFFTGLKGIDGVKVGGVELPVDEQNKVNIDLSGIEAQIRWMMDRIHLLTEYSPWIASLAWSDTDIWHNS